MKITKDNLLEKGIVIDDANNIRPTSNVVLEPPVRLGKTAIRSAQIGAYTYIRSGMVHNVESIGRFCSIAPNVNIGMVEHPITFLSTHPFQYDENEFAFWKEDQEFGTRVKKRNTKKMPSIGNDVWIGTDVIITRGVTIGDGAIIAAGSVVTKDVKPYEIVGGVPAKHIKFRFDEKTIERLLQIRWWQFTNLSLKGLDFTNVESCIEELEKRLAEGKMVERATEKVVIQNRMYVEEKPLNQKKTLETQK